MSFSLVGSVVELVVFVLGAIGLPGLFALTAVEGFGVPPLPSEVILPFAGFLVAQGTFSFTGALVAAVLGELVGAYAAYAVGRQWRHRIERIAVGRFRLEPKHLEAMDRFFARRGEATVALARLVPVVRSYISYPAGTARMEPIRFGVYTTLGATPFTLALLYAGMQLGSHWSTVSSYFTDFDYVAAALVAAGVVYLILLVGGWITPGWPPRWASRRTQGTPSTVPRPPPP